MNSTFYQTRSAATSPHFQTGGEPATRIFAALPIFCLLLLTMALPAHAQTPLWTGIVAPSRAVDWSKAGVVGGIPTNRTQCGSTIAAYTGTPATINNAIAACPAGTYVLLGAGTFHLSGGIKIQAPTWNVTIRGMGANQTFLVFSGSDGCMGFNADVCVESSDLNYGMGPQNLTNWTAGYSQGATTISLAAVTNLKVGNPIVLDQVDDSSIGDTLLVCSQSSPGAPACALQGQAGGLRGGRAQAQIVQVTQCDGNTTNGHTCSSGANITITPGLYMANWSSSRSPQAWWSSGPIQGAGVEDMSVDNTATDVISVGFQNCFNCWVKGVTSIMANYAHFWASLSDHVSIVNNYAFRNQGTGADNYGVVNYGSSDTLSENNIVQGVPLPENMTGAGPGSVFGYNFNILNFYGTVGGTPGYLLGSFWDHTSGTELVLFEGNHGSSVAFDLIHGTHNLDTLFRNYFPGQGSCITGPQSGGILTSVGWGTSTLGACTNDLSPIVLNAYGGRIFNIVGNVLGQTGVQVSYLDDVSAPAAAPSIYSTGYGNFAGGITVANDTQVNPLLLKWGNCDAVTGFSAANCRFNSGEVPSGLGGDQAFYANSVPGSHTLPASFYYSSKPSWWPSGKAWPAIGPDVSGGNESGTGGLANSIPAEDCYISLGGASNGFNATPLSFSESACYGVTSVIQPQPPTSLIATVN